MAVYKRKWYHNIYFEFYLGIPFLEIQTHLFKEAVERMTYDICRLRIKLYKWSWEFQLYKRPDMLPVGSSFEPKQRLSQQDTRSTQKPTKGDQEIATPHQPQRGGKTL